jgi:hypothetical protein
MAIGNCVRVRVYVCVCVWGECITLQIICDELYLEIFVVLSQGSWVLAAVSCRYTSHVSIQDYTYVCW